MSILTVPIDYMGIWHWGWAFGLFICVGLIFDGLTLATLTLSYFLLRGIFLLEAPVLPFGDYTRAFQATAGQAVVEMFLVTFGAVMLTSKYDRYVKHILRAVVVIEIAMVWYQRAGLMGWESFDNAFIALCLPFIGYFPLSAAALVTICTHHGSTALLIIFVQALCLDWKVGLFFWAPTGLALAWLHHNGAWLDGTDRLEHWARELKFWLGAGDAAFFIGTGPGSFMWLSLLMDKFQAPLFLCAHNDWLQILFEGGVIGFGLAVTFYGWAIKRAWQNKKLLAAVLGVGVFALTFHPLRFWPTAMVIGITFARVLKMKSPRRKYVLHDES